MSGKKNYSRVGGHWVTLVGFGLDRDGKESPAVLIVHDPGSRSGNYFSSDYIRLEEMGAGKMEAANGLTTYTAGFYRLCEMDPPGNADLGILDGAIRLKMKKPLVSDAG